MRLPWRQREQLPEAIDGQLASMYSTLGFVLKPGHPMRAAPCVTCRQVIGGDPVRIAGLVALGGQPCTCGALPADMFLTHAAHPQPRVPDLLPVVTQQAASGHEHDWEPVR